MPKVFQYEITVAGDGLDDNRHVNNIEYLRWMQSAAIAHSEAQGGTSRMKAAGLTWVVRTHHIDYLIPAFADDKVSILTWVASFGKISSVRKYRLVREGDKALIVRAETNWVCVESETGRPRRIPTDVREAFDVVPEGEEPIF